MATQLITKDNAYHIQALIQSGEDVEIHIAGLKEYIPELVISNKLYKEVTLTKYELNFKGSNVYLYPIGYTNGENANTGTLRAIGGRYLLATYPQSIQDLFIGTKPKTALQLTLDFFRGLHHSFIEDDNIKVYWSGLPLDSNVMIHRINCCLKDQKVLIDHRLRQNPEPTIKRGISITKKQINKPTVLKALPKRKSKNNPNGTNKPQTPFRDIKIKEPGIGKVCVKILTGEDKFEIQRLSKPEATVMVETRPTECSYVSKAIWKQWKSDLSLKTTTPSARASKRLSKQKGVAGDRFRKLQIIKPKEKAKTTTEKVKPKRISNINDYMRIPFLREEYIKGKGFVTTLAKYKYILVSPDDSRTSSMSAEKWINTNDREKAKILLEDLIKEKQGDKIKDVVIDNLELIPMSKKDHLKITSIRTLTVEFPSNDEINTIVVSKKGTTTALDKWQKKLEAWIIKKYGDKIHHKILTKIQPIKTVAKSEKKKSSASQNLFEKVSLPITWYPKFFKNKKKDKTEDGGSTTSIEYTPLTSVNVFKRKKQDKPSVVKDKKKWICPMPKKAKKLSQLVKQPRIGLQIK